MKILLIRPRWAEVGRPNKLKLDVARIPPLALGIIAALTPGEEVRVVNEDVEAVPYAAPFDLVGITVHTFTARRAYEMAGRWRAQGARVVLGGPHPSFLPEEAREHADAVVIGEAEPVWATVVVDAAAGRLAPLYRGQAARGTFSSPPPARHLLSPRRHLKYVQLTRGCVNTCQFCYLRGYPAGAYARRAVETVVAEIAAFRDKVFFITDDNLFCDRAYALSFLRAVAPLRRHFWLEAPTTLGLDGELLDALRDAGCFSVTLGFQSVDPAAVAAAEVRHNRVEAYRKVIDAVHRRGLFVEGFFIFGFDQDSPAVFDETFRFVRETDLDGAVLHLLTPIPGTPFYRQMASAGRLLTTDYDRYDWDHCVIRPVRMGAEELEAGVDGLYRRLRDWYRRRQRRAYLANLSLLWRAPRLAAFLAAVAHRHP